ncbi:hypothetical protein GGX14DRAFT_383989 [Mycena pura]|uniref:Uncharacterized protein n=1 Tax=Mycena pura TaxID=153505 RepID=A0AAD6YV93_9AGAR|nr:hypothetical protein GGX14DRAFT_383989 [Mycena pura]
MPLHVLPPYPRPASSWGQGCMRGMGALGQPAMRALRTAPTSPSLHVGVQERAYTRGMAARVSVHTVSACRRPERHRPLFPWQGRLCGYTYTGRAGGRRSSTKVDAARQSSTKVDNAVSTSHRSRRQMINEGRQITWVNRGSTMVDKVIRDVRRHPKLRLRLRLRDSESTHCDPLNTRPTNSAITGFLRSPRHNDGDAGQDDIHSKTQ